MGTPNSGIAVPPNQATRQSNQNYTIDINQLYTDWISAIDAIRSSATLNPQATLQKLISQANGDITGLTSTLTLAQTPQESRCHAFFRWCGLPVVGSNFQFYNPGFDVVLDSTRTINLQDKITIGTSPLPGFNTLSAARETYVQTNLTIFSNPTAVNAGVLALSSGGTSSLRTFNMSTLNGTTFSASTITSWSDTTIKDQTYTYDTTALAGITPDLTDLSLFQDSNGNTIGTPGFSISGTRSHIIFPLIVDPRIDFSIAPQSKLVAIPFVPDNSYIKVNATANAVYPPLIERIIKERVNMVQASTSGGTAVETVLSYVTNLPFIQNNPLIIQAESYGGNDQTAFIDAVNTIRAMMSLLDKAVKNIAKIQGLYYYIPAPSITGPEGGSTIQGVFIPTAINQSLLSSLDRDIIVSTALGTLNSNNVDVSTSSTNPDTGNFNGAAAPTTFKSDTTGALGNNNSKNLATLIKNRNQLMSSANNSLMTIEIIMGEFSGFGLCDVVAIISALRTIPLTSLMGLLDPDSFTRMQAAYPGSWDQDSLSTSMAALTTSVQGFYSIMD